jgi:hypothetical protein
MAFLLSLASSMFAEPRSILPALTVNQVFMQKKAMLCITPSVLWYRSIQASPSTIPPDDRIGDRGHA